MRYVTTRGALAAEKNQQRPASVSLRTAMLEGLAPDGGLYVPETIEPWREAEIQRLPERTLTEVAYRALRPYTRPELDATICEAVVAEALNFPIPLIEVEPGIFALELFHGPTLAFKDVGARTMARLMASLDSGDQPLTVLAATSGDTGSAVAHAFHGVPHTRVIVLYPDGRVSPVQEAQLTMFNSEDGNVRAYAVDGSFDDCHRLTKEAFANADVRRAVRLTSANSVNIGRLLPQMVYYFHGVAQAMKLRPGTEIHVCTPSGNFGNLTAGLIAKRAGLPIAKFVAATNVNDVVPAYLQSGLFEPRASVQTIANAMDVGHPSNFERMRWLYHDSLDAMRADVDGCRRTDEEVRATIRRVYEERGYLLDPHSAIGYMGIKSHLAQAGQAGGSTDRIGIFLATAHPAKFSEVVEPVLGRPLDLPPALAEVVARPRHVLKINATFEAVRRTLSA
ncbi:MAG: threonine synthase [Vicinamibacterales bacterium]